jgi:hypothetical protein
MLNNKSTPYPSSSSSGLLQSICVNPTPTGFSNGKICEICVKILLPQRSALTFSKGARSAPLPEKPFSLRDLCGFLFLFLFLSFFLPALD